MKSKSFILKIDFVNFFFFISYLFLLFFYRGYIFGNFAFEEDAISYYEHIKYFIDNVSHRVFPLWDAVWEYGSPNEFFLRRLGDSNPFYLVLVFLKLTTMPFKTAYGLFFLSYYFLGMIGFYFVSKQLLKDKYFALISFMAFCFSSFSTLVFDSFIILIFTPMIWFIYFFNRIIFKHCLFSILFFTFCLMILNTTYIPFYFYVVFGVYFLLIFIFFPIKIIGHLKSLLKLILDNKKLVFVCAVLVIISLYPGYSLFKNASSNDFVMPARTLGIDVANQFQVQKQSTYLGGSVSLNPFVVPDELRDIFYNLKNFKLGFLFVPLIVYLAFCLGLFLGVDKISICITSFIVTFYLISLYDASPIYQILFKHVFFFKYFRNFQFFLWLAILPGFVVLSAYQFKRIFDEVLTSKSRVMITTIVISHLFVLIGLMYFKSQMISSYLLVLVILLAFLKAMKNGEKFKVSFFIIVIIFSMYQIVEGYRYLNVNAERPFVSTQYDKDNMRRIYLRNESVIDGNNFDLLSIDSVVLSRERISSVYYSTFYLNKLKKIIGIKNLSNYARNKFIIYDSAKCFAEKSLNDTAILNYFMMNHNTAIVNCDADSDILKNSKASSKILIEGSQNNFYVSKYNSNYLKVLTDYNEDKLLVFNDSFDKKWSAYVDGKAVTLYRANVAFKGIFIPSGAREIEFKYGKKSEYFLKWFLLMFYLFVFVLGLIHFSIGIINEKQNN